MGGGGLVEKEQTARTSPGTLHADSVAGSRRAGGLIDKLIWISTTMASPSPIVVVMWWQSCEGGAYKRTEQV
jgi:hypothetical protein